MGMMFPLGLSIWRRRPELLPFLWSANGSTSMRASVLGVALSIQFGIAATYGLGVALYAVCVAMLAVRREGSEPVPAAVETVEGPALVPDDAAAPAAAPARAPQAALER
jgi:hypothetical protein